MVFFTVKAGSVLNARDMAHYPHGKSLQPAVETKKKMHTVSTKLQAMAVGEKTSNEVALGQFSVVSCRICSRSVVLMASDNLHVAQVVYCGLQRFLQLQRFLHNNKASQQPKYQCRFLLFVDWIEDSVTST